MIRAIWTLVKVGLFVALVLWIAERPGTVMIDWMQFKFTIHVGLFLIGVLLTVVLGIIIFTLIKATLDLPDILARRRRTTRRDKGFKALTIGLAAVAAGDAKNASYQAQRARHLLDQDHALSQLLEAQAARLEGREGDAASFFIELMKNKDASFLGVRGLLQSTLDTGDDAGALELAYRALKEQPKQAWILRLIYDLEIRLRHWGKAEKILRRMEKAGAVSVEDANSDRVAMMLAQADEAGEKGEDGRAYRFLQKAYKRDRSFVPTIVRLGSVLLARGKHKRVASMVEEAWRYAPHPDLASLWGEAYVPPKHHDSVARVRWFEDLAALDPDSVEGLLVLANVQISEGLWAEARKSLEHAEHIAPGAALYKLWARLEERATHDDMAVRAWLDKAADAPAEHVWMCGETGRIYDFWMPVSDQGLFNTIIWDVPQGRVVAPVLQRMAIASL